MSGVLTPLKFEDRQKAPDTLAAALPPATHELEDEDGVALGVLCLHPPFGCRPASRKRAFPAGVENHSSQYQDGPAEHPALLYL